MSLRHYDNGFLELAAYQKVVDSVIEKVCPQVKITVHETKSLDIGLLEYGYDLAVHIGEGKIVHTYLTAPLATTDASKQNVVDNRVQFDEAELTVWITKELKKVAPTFKEKFKTELEIN